jgi:hypothetical protein
LPADFVVYDDTDSKEVIKEVFGYSKVASQFIDSIPKEYLVHTP